MSRRACRIEHGVNCRIGSLENVAFFQRQGVEVNCRIGSLEKDLEPSRDITDVNCRIGSLESPQAVS